MAYTEPNRTTLNDKYFSESVPSKTQKFAGIIALILAALIAGMAFLPPVTKRTMPVKIERSR